MQFVTSTIPSCLTMHTLIHLSCFKVIAFKRHSIGIYRKEGTEDVDLKRKIRIHGMYNGQNMCSARTTDNIRWMDGIYTVG